MPLYFPSSTPAHAPAAPSITTATGAQYVSGQGDGVLTTSVVWTSGAEVTILHAATITLDLGTLINARLYATGNFVLANPVNAKPGQSGHIRITQDPSGSRTISYGSAWRKAASDSAALSTTAGAVDLLYYNVIDASTIVYTIRKAVA